MIKQLFGEELFIMLLIETSNKLLGIRDLYVFHDSRGERHEFNPATWTIVARL